MTDFQEQRRHVRIRCEHSLSVTPINRTVTGWSSGSVRILSKDISAGGIRLRLPKFLPVRDALRFELLLEQPRRRLIGTAVVRWIRRIGHLDAYDAGVQFTSLSNEMCNALQEYCERFVNAEKLNWKP